MSKEEARYKKYEIPQETPTWERSIKRPETPLQSLMEAAPFQETDISIIELLPIREALVDAFEELDEEEKWVLNSLVVERMSIRELGYQINAPKTSIARIRDRALGRMRELLSDNPVIMEVMKGTYRD